MAGEGDSRTGGGARGARSEGARRGRGWGAGRRRRVLMRRGRMV